MIATIMSAAALIAVVIAISMPTVHDYSMELRNISHQLSRIANNLALIAERMDKQNDSD